MDDPSVRDPHRPPHYHSGMPAPKALSSLSAMIASAFVAQLLISQTAFAQATVDPNARAGDAGRPAPAAQRGIGPDLDAWWQDAVFYEVFVRSFADSTAGPLAGDGIGDLRGLIERLDYLNDGDATTDTDLGVTALWLMPIMESPSYHGYDVTDYRRVDPDYGTNEDFLELIEACEQRGIRVILDLVLNHCSREHPWFVEAAGDPDSPKRDWFTFEENRPDWKGPWNQPVWHKVPGADDHYYGVFWAGMPDLNYRNPEVTREMIDVTRFWIEEMGAHGFRLDAIRHLIEEGRVQSSTPATHRWLKMYHDEVKKIDEDVFLVGEIWSDTDDVSRYVGDQMDAAFEFDLANKIIEGLRVGRGKPIAVHMHRLTASYPHGMYATFLRNHDQNRTVHELGGDVEAAKLAASIQFAMPGVPFIYYGEELGMSASKPDPDLRTPMQWDAGEGAGFTTGTAWKAPKTDHSTVNVAAQMDDAGSMLSHYRRLVRARQGSDALRIGSLSKRFVEDPRILIWVREHEGEQVLCVFNTADERLPLGDLPLDSELGASLIGGRDGVPDELEARGAWIVEVLD